MSPSQPPLADIFAALADTTRLQIYRRLLRQRNICVSDLAVTAGISVPAASQHLQILERAGFITRQRQGQKVCYCTHTNTALVRALTKLIKEYKP